MQKEKRITRRTVLKTLAMSVPVLGLGTQALLAERRNNSRQVLGKNVVLFITDQERAIQHFPVNWERDNLPGLTRLKRNGLSFENAFTDACMCSPARSTLMTGYFTAQHGVKYTLEENMSDPHRYPQVVLPLDLPNIASVMSAAGYNVVYKGKWHCSKPADPGGVWVPSDVGQYGFTRWNPQDAGANQDIDQGGGPPTISPPWTSGNNDGRFMYDDGDYQDGEEGVLAYLNSVAVGQQPFFLIVSLVNPHDVLFYPNNYIAATYCTSPDCSWLMGDIEIPATIGESHIVSIREDRYKLAEYYDVRGVKPSQWEMYDLLTDPLEVNNLANVSRTPQQQREYERLQAKLAEVKATRLQPLPAP